tara:strand:+ start:180 stop:362 length:183 start_codon:yes stop_codon:yes gene_type:complete
MTWWLKAHIILAIIILVKNYNGTLEDSLNKFEEKIGIYTPPQDSTKIDTFTIEIEDESRS